MLREFKIQHATCWLDVAERIKHYFHGRISRDSRKKKKGRERKTVSGRSPLLNRNSAFVQWLLLAVERDRCAKIGEVHSMKTNERFRGSRSFPGDDFSSKRKIFRSPRRGWKGLKVNVSIIQSAIDTYRFSLYFFRRICAILEKYLREILSL